MRRMISATAVACALVACGGDDGSGDPGRVTLHRLNNAEYNNTVHDLLGTELRPADNFPADDRGFGFDNVADVLRLSPLSVELYQAAAEALITDALATPTSSMTQQFEVVGESSVGNVNGSGWLFFTNGTAAITALTPIAATYRITVRAYGQQAGPIRPGCRSRFRTRRRRSSTSPPPRPRPRTTRSRCRCRPAAPRSPSGSSTTTTTPPPAPIATCGSITSR